ncbi:MAG: hypothetical protein JWN44_6837 [Myxococcales bacterium]|nr:hypothetical protein [Myxococcales bacterium]
MSSYGDGALTPRRLVLVFCRSPRDESRVKPLAARSRPQAERLHRALLERALAAAAETGADVRLVTTPAVDDMRALAARYVPAARLEVTLQRGDSFGARLEAAVRDAFADGYGPIALLGGDTADLTGAHLAGAFAALDRGAGAVVGPARDGGYYLLALAAFTRAPFDGVALQTSATFAATVAALAATGLDVATLSPLRDVDDAEGVVALARFGSAPERRAALALLSALVAPLARLALPRLLASAVTHEARGPPILR